MNGGVRMKNVCVAYKTKTPKPRTEYEKVMKNYNLVLKGFDLELQ